MSPHEIAHLQLLKTLDQHPELSQRELARELGASLGKTHYLLKALAEKGLIKAGNFRRHDNKLAYLYLLTPEGVGEKLRLASAYLARKEAEYESLHDEIALLRRQMAADAMAASLAPSVAAAEETASPCFAAKPWSDPGFCCSRLPVAGAKP